MSHDGSNEALVFTADDCTGALESAAACADSGREVVVRPWSAFDRQEPVDAAASNALTACVIDLRSRHVSPEVAAQRISAVMARHGVRAHKIDSTLRGNWVAEVGAIVSAGRRVLMVAAYPAAGRTCRGGVVLENGVPVDQTAHGNDPRSPAVTSRPASVLPDCSNVADTEELERWLESGSSCAVADAASLDDIRQLVARAASVSGVLIVGTAAVIGAVATVGAPNIVPVVSAVVGPTLVVCGSMHPTSRQQVARLVDGGCPLVRVPGDCSPLIPAKSGVLMSADPELGVSDDPAEVARQLANSARELLRDRRWTTVVVIGGDTAQEVLGDATVTVFGSLDVGVAFGRFEMHGRSIGLVSKPGGFGGPSTLVDLMSSAW